MYKFFISAKLGKSFISKNAHMIVLISYYSDQLINQFTSFFVASLYNFDFFHEIQVSKDLKVQSGVLLVV